jgi:hypothetical protein
MRLLILILLVFFISCKNGNNEVKQSSTVKTVKYFEFDSTTAQEVTYLDTLTQKGKKVLYNAFSDTVHVEFTISGQLDSIQHYIYRCEHWPDTIDKVTEIANVKHSSKHKQFLTYTEIFKPTKRKIIYDTARFLEDSLFVVNKTNYKGPIY